MIQVLVMKRQNSLNAVALATAILCSSVAGGALDQANPQLPSGFTLGPSADYSSVYATEDWAVVGPAQVGNQSATVGMNWRSYDRFGENMRDVDVIFATQTTNPNGTDYLIVNVVFACSQPVMAKLTTVSYYRLDGTLLAPTENRTGDMERLEETSPVFRVGSLVCSADRPGNGRYSSARDFVLSVR